MSGLLAKAVVGVLKRRAAKSVTTWIGGALVAAGGTAAVAPDVLELIPENYRGAAVVVVGAVVVLSRHRKEIFELYGTLRAEFKAAVAAAEKDSAPPSP